MSKVAVCYPSSDNVNAAFVTSMFKFIVKNKTPITRIINVVSSRIAFNRNGCIEQALETDATHILFIDADMVFPTNALEKLMAHDLDIVGATASRRGEDDDAIGFTFNGERLSVPSPPIKMLWMGPPFMLIKMDVFKKLKKPWFAEPPWWMMNPEYDINGTLRVSGHEAFPECLVPEDQYFCLRAQQSGYDIWCDIELSLEMKHYGSKAYEIMKPQEDNVPVGKNMRPVMLATYEKTPQDRQVA